VDEVYGKTDVISAPSACESLSLRNFRPVIEIGHGAYRFARISRERKRENLVIAAPEICTMSQNTPVIDNLLN